MPCTKNLINRNLGKYDMVAHNIPYVAMSYEYRAMEKITTDIMDYYLVVCDDVLYANVVHMGYYLALCEH